MQVSEEEGAGSESDVKTELNKLNTVLNNLKISGIFTDYEGEEEKGGRSEQKHAGQFEIF